ncbi:MAG TPA: MFS transporter [Planctomycetia bacterium]|nr:MFS transporter [Planctomycetia bacterium]
MSAPEARSLRDLDSNQWRSGTAAWLGWLFDGLDMHLYTMVATKFVAELMRAPSQSDPAVLTVSGWIQAAFLVGWALGGGFFGRIGDRLGRSRALSLTILTYALFTGLSYFADAWWHLLIFRFVAALGIGGEWAVGASLLAETWPKSWRPMIAAVLQTAVNVGVLIAAIAVWLMAGVAPRNVFLIGVLPALLVFWIRRAVPEPEEWRSAKLTATVQPGIADLFRGPVRRISILTIAVCSLSLTAHWAFMFWYAQHLGKLAAAAPPVAELNDWLLRQSSRFDVSTGMWKFDETRFRAVGFVLVMLFSIVGNFFAGWLALRRGYRASVIGMCCLYCAAMLAAYGVERDATTILYWLPAVGFSQGVFALFTMYLPSLYPVLLRTTGAGFCYNIGRIFAAIGTVVFGVAAASIDFRQALFVTGFLFLPAAVVALALPEPKLDQT